jgi:NaMN:DMB phosphoribosyltransferase
VPFLAVPDQRGHQGGGDRLPAERLALFPEQDQAVVFGLVVQAAQRADEVLDGAAPAAAVAAGQCVLLDLLRKLPDVRRRRLVQVPGAPLADDPVPVGGLSS